MELKKSRSVRLSAIVGAAVAIGAAFSATASSSDGKAVLAILSRPQAQADRVPDEYNPNRTLAEASTRLLYGDARGRAWVGTNDTYGTCLLIEFHHGGDWVAGISCDTDQKLSEIGVRLEVELLGQRRGLMLVPDSVDARWTDTGLESIGASRLAPNLIEMSADGEMHVDHAN